MATLKFKQIMLQVLRYAPTQLTNAAFARIKEFKGIRKDQDGRYYAYAITYSTKVFDKRRGMWVTKKMPTYYDTFIMVRHYKRNKGYQRQSTIVMSCSCPDFKYRHEVALTLHGGSFFKYSNARRPKITNPRLRRTCCKHCLRFYQFLSKEYPSLFTPSAELKARIGDA